MLAVANSLSLVDHPAFVDMPGSTFCGVGCLSNCDALAECGPNAAPGNSICALNVCCSQFGFCGTTDDFCGTGCTGPNCGQPKIPTGVNSDVTSRVIGYYEVFMVSLILFLSADQFLGMYRASSRVCDAWFPQNIPASGYTHLNYAFASIDPNTFEVVPALADDIPNYTAFTGLKQANSNLKTYISVGGWSFNDPPTQHVFSDTASSLVNQRAFAKSLVSFMVQYGFDGVDIDWEYPVACERGGVPADKENMVALFKTMRETFDASGHTFGITFTAPSSFWYLQHYDLLGLLSYADWVNLMSYDLHGVWDEKDIYIGSVVQAHTNLTEIVQSVQLFQRVGVPLEKIVLGMGFYGRTFQLTDPTCTTPGCHFSGPAPGGPCTASDGILSFAEIEQIVAQSNSTPVYDKTAQVKYLVYDDDNWVSYDDAVTFQAKVSWAKGAGLGGLMVWALDLDDFDSTANNALLDGNIPKAHDLNSGYVQMTGVLRTLFPFQSIKQRIADPIQQALAEENLLGSQFAVLLISNRKAVSGEVLHHSATVFVNVCPTGTFVKDRDYYGDTGIFHACFMQEKQLCCAPPKGASTTSPFNPADLFPNPPADGDLDWDLQDDPIDESAPNGGDAANDNSFGLLALDGPSNLLSSVGISSDWVILGCQDNSDTLQTVTAFCSAKNTIVKMPPGCGGTFARLAHLEINPDMTVPDTHAGRKPEANPVYEMHFDYNFHLIWRSETRTADDGEVLLRADVTTLPGYWAEIDTADPGSSVRRDLEERWFGGFDDWLKRLTKVKSDTSADLVMQKSFSSVLFSASQHCESEDGTLTFDASISVTAQGNARAHLNYGFYLEGSLFPLNVDSAYVYANSDASASLGFAVTGRAELQYDTGRIPLVPELAWPGLKWPGIITVGPTFNIYGQIIGQLSLSGTFGATAAYTLPQGHVSFGLVGGTQTPVDKGSDTAPGQEYGWTIQPTLDVELGGSLGVHVIPEAAAVFTVFPGTPLEIGAQATITVDGALVMSFNANLQGVDASIDAQVDFLAGASGLGGTVGPFNFFHQDYNLYSTSISFSDSPARRSISTPRDLPGNNSFGSSMAKPFRKKRHGGTGSNLQYFEAREGSLESRGLFSGLFDCPQPKENNGTSGSCADALADSVPDPDPDDGDDELETRSEEHIAYQNTLPDGIWDLLELDE
uniref:Chitinase n=1 Tax=Psilocybe cubensis TaxID=181762 RepID=A0A8H7XJL8_PSICU